MQVEVARLALAAMCSRNLLANKAESLAALAWSGMVRYSGAESAAASVASAAAAPAGSDRELQGWVLQSLYCATREVSAPRVQPLAAAVTRLRQADVLCILL